MYKLMYTIQDEDHRDNKSQSTRHKVKNVEINILSFKRTLNKIYRKRLIFIFL